MWYAPYGEALVDEHIAHYENPLKFSGKELDEITGLYDHGARNRNPISTLWYGIDPLWEKYPDFSPYNYCAGNPVRLVDPDGRDVFYNYEGEYVGSNNNIYEGSIFITKEKEISPSTSIPLQEAGLKASTYSKIYTDVLARKGLDINTLHNSRISVYGSFFCKDINAVPQMDFDYIYNNPWEKVRFLSTSLDNEDGIKISVNQNSCDTKTLLTTVENVYNSIGIHEYDGHGILKYSDASKDHYQAYELQMSDPSWKDCTLPFKIGLMENYLRYRRKETGFDEVYKSTYETWLFYKDLQKNQKYLLK